MHLFWKSLCNHPGVPMAAMLTILGFIAGLNRKTWPEGLYGGLMGMAIMGLFWIPVLITAWTGRKYYQ